MILAPVTDDLSMRSSGVVQTTSYTIKASAKAFSILSSGLYSDKILAICRELGCNAADSHVAAGTDRPFEVHLPNLLEPHFSVRDFGVGLSHEDVMTVYTTYFESTKTTSNDFTGALGLGSKSPFSYTNNFTVTTIKDGYKGIYTAYINESGFPSCALLHRSETEEPNGVEVMFSVTDTSDFHKFQIAAARAYAYFEQQPVITGCTAFTHLGPNIGTIALTPNLFLVKTHRVSYFSTSSSVAVMGNVAYPIDIPSGKTQLTEQQQDMLNSGLEMHFAIGELDFQASREGLSYIPMTVDAIKRRLDEAIVELDNAIAEGLANTKTEWERHDFVGQLDSPAYGKALLRYIATASLTFKYAPIINGGSSSTAAYMQVDAQQPTYNIELKMYSKHPKRKPSVIRTKVDAKTGQLFHTLPIKPSTRFVSSPARNGFTAMGIKYAAEPKSVVVVLMSPINRKKPMDVAGFLDSIDNPPGFDGCLSTVQQVKAPTTAKKSAPTPQLLAIRGESLAHTHRIIFRTIRSSIFADVVPLIDDPKVTKLYVPLIRHSILSKSIQPRYTKHFLTRLLDIGLVSDTDVLFGVRSQQVGRIEKLPDWKLLDVHITESIAAMPDAMLEEMIWEDFAANAHEQYDNIYRAASQHPKVLDHQVFKQFITNAHRASVRMAKQSSISHDLQLVSHTSTKPQKMYPWFGDSRRSRLVSLFELCALLSIDHKPLAQRVRGLAKNITSIFDRYPLLAIFAGNKASTSGREQMLEMLVQYVKLVDSAANIVAPNVNIDEDKTPNTKEAECPALT